jgi:hypothetical protein
MEHNLLFEQLYKQNISYLVCGGLAVNIYGIPRMTADIDILLDFEDKNVNKFENAMKLLSYFSAIPISLKIMVDKVEREKMIREKNMIAYSFFNSRAGVMALDVLVDVPIAFDELWNNREVRKLNSFEVNLVSVEHLIELKKYSNRKQDNDDILLLSKLLKNG